MKPFTFILSLGMIVIATYAAFAVWQSRSVPKTVAIDSIENFKGLPATHCTLGNSAGTIGGDLYVFHELARFDIISRSAGRAVAVHLIVNRDDGAFYWQEGEEGGVRGDYNRIYAALGLQAISRIDCGSWWIPYGGLFIVPQGTTFSQTI